MRSPSLAASGLPPRRTARMPTVLLMRRRRRRKRVSLTLRLLRRSRLPRPPGSLHRRQTRSLRRRHLRRPPRVRDPQSPLLVRLLRNPLQRVASLHPVQALGSQRRRRRLPTVMIRLLPLLLLPPRRSPRSQRRKLPLLKNLLRLDLRRVHCPHPVSLFHRSYPIPSRPASILCTILGYSADTRTPFVETSHHHCRVLRLRFS
ncbi:hypothetical protein DENSPDRAFT_930437 [Dentipellis sp. KUC8613]|nr:hypothetical protein DENSPDRAFT_930437 [Dentipellis sp. KUC8613]